MLDVNFVLIGDLIMYEVVLDLKGLSDRRSYVDVLALVSEIVGCTSMEQLLNTAIICQDRVHICTC